ncbi:MAG: NAD(P)-dependent alcohol dehydrogenase [Blastochloris sp.]|nr:NAD(P)-dependent alcohol dehydrogenase [Blastochloris sp.]
MKAAVYKRYGPPEVVHVMEVPTPVPTADEVLIRIHATTVASGDWRVRSLQVPRGFGLIARLFFGVSSPRNCILGTELSGTIEAIGANVSQWCVGDKVLAFPGVGMRCHAEYRTMSASGNLVAKPSRLSFEQAAALCFGGTAALYFLRNLGNIQRGEHVLILGASGAIGTAAVQLAKHFGAEVSAVCSSANAQLVAGLGADHVIDYAKEDFTRNLSCYDIIFDTVGATSFARCQEALKPNGRLLLAAADLLQMLDAARGRRAQGKCVFAGTAPEKRADLEFLCEVVELGQFVPIIDSTYSLESIVAAHARVDTGRKRGNVVVVMPLPLSQ